ncbi:MAG TPA: TolC family protein [Candidatus Acidoferrum sp.]|nr:TolC family protein [Candidatus Acidoferrum sp.]
MPVFARRGLSCWLILFFIVWLPPRLSAADSTLTLRDAIAATLQANPQLQVYRFRAQALRGEQTTAGLTPPLQVNSLLENVLGTGSANGIDGGELTLSLSRVIELGDKRAARIEVVSRRLDLLDAQRRIEELDLLAEVTRRFIAVAASQQQLALRQRAVTLARQTLDNVQTLVVAGQSPAAEQQRAAAALARATVEQGQADNALQTAKLELAESWASQRPEFTGVSADLLAVGTAGDIDALLQTLDGTADIQLYAGEERLQQAKLLVAQDERRADVQWTAGIRHLGAVNDTGFVIGASMPLGSERRATGAIAAAQAEIAEVAGRRDVALNRLRTQVSVLHLQLQRAIADVQALRDQVLPPLASALEQTRAAYLGGRYGYLELASAQSEVLAAEQSLLDAAAKAHLLRVEIERLSGAPLNAVNTESKP